MNIGSRQAQDEAGSEDPDVTGALAAQSFKDTYKKIVEENRDLSKALNQRKLVEALNQSPQIFKPPVGPQGPGAAPNDAFPVPGRDPNMPLPYGETGLPTWVRMNANTKQRPLPGVPDVKPIPRNPPAKPKPKPAAKPPPGMPLGMADPKMALQATQFGANPTNMLGGAKPTAQVPNSYTQPAPTPTPVAKPAVPYV